MGMTTMRIMMRTAMMPTTTVGMTATTMTTMVTAMVRTCRTSRRGW